MSNKDYSKIRLINFLKQTLSKNKSDDIYLNLENKKIIYLKMDVKDWNTKVYLVWDKYIFLWEIKLWDSKTVNKFSNYIDMLIHKYNLTMLYNNIT